MCEALCCFNFRSSSPAAAQKNATTSIGKGVLEGIIISLQPSSFSTSHGVRPHYVPQLDYNHLRSRGYAVLLRGIGASVVTEMVSQIRKYFNQPVSIKQVDVHPSGGDERGFVDCGTRKQLFLVRDSGVPKMLAATTNYWRLCHELAVRCLRDIETDLLYQPGTLTSLVDQSDDPPHVQMSASLLRLFQYSSSSSVAVTDEVLSAQHTDLGLLALGVRTAPGLECWDHSQRAFLNAEQGLQNNDVVIVVGDSLRMLTNGIYSSARHRVVAGAEERVAIIFHLRMRCDATFDAAALSTPRTGTFHSLFRDAADWMHHLRSKRWSVNAPVD